MNPSITYILSLDHSGSTFLQYLLATQTHFLGIGEVNQLAKGRGWDDGDPVCSCGELLSNCQVWQTVESIPRSNAIEWYRELTSFLQQKYPQFTHWIDSSKSFEGLEPWLQLHREGAIQIFEFCSAPRRSRMGSLRPKNSSAEGSRFSPFSSLHAVLVASSKTNYQSTHPQKLNLPNRLL